MPSGIIGGRLYHVITSPEKYFGVGGKPIEALYIWQGGLGIWGAISLGALGAFLAYRKHPKRGELPFSTFADAIAPGLFPSEMGDSLPPESIEYIKRMTPLGRLGDPDELAATLVWLVSDAASYVTGITVPVEGGLVMP